MKKLVLPALALCLPIFAGPAQAEDIKTLLSQQVGNPAQLAPNTIAYSYTMTLDLTNIDGKDVSNAQAVLRIDPSQPGGSRAQIISVSNPENEALQEFLKDIEDPEKTMAEQAEGFWCGNGDLEKNIDFDPADLTVISEDDTQAVVRPDMVKLAELLMGADEDGAGDDGRKMMKKLLKRIDGEITLSKPSAQIMGFSVRMTRPMTMMLVAKLKNMTADQSCALAPNGHYHLASMKAHVDGKALGKAFGQDMDIQISDLTPLP